MKQDALDATGQREESTPAVVWRFGRFAVLPHARQLLADGQPVKLGARAFDILLLLLECHGRITTKQDLLDRVWPGTVIEDNNLHLHVSTLRKLLGHNAISTVPSRGYVLTVAVERSTPPHQRQARDDVARSSAPAAATVGDHDHIPADLPPLFGRDAELESLRVLMAENRVVTVVGPGGIGKTRLALEAARAWLARRSSPVCVVDLSGLMTGAPVAEALARALGIQLPEHQDATAEVIDILRPRALLIVFDNCEHCVNEVSDLVERIARDSQRVRVLATSQVALHTSTEQVFTLGPLGVPGPDTGPSEILRYGAVALFAARVTAALGEFSVGRDNTDDVVAICRSLEGLPLAIELAAARVPLLGLPSLRARLKGRDDARFMLLKGGSRSTLPRHQTLYTAIDWSYRLLDEEQRRVFRCIGIFSGSFTLEAALAVCARAVDGIDESGRLIDVLGSLVDRSLVVVLGDRPTRYRLLNSTRAFALEQLRTCNELRTIERQRALTLLELFEVAEADRWQLIPRQRIAAAAAELDNLRGALNWLAGDPDEAALHVALAGAAGWIWPRVSLRLEGKRRCQQALARVDESTDPALEARLQLACARHSHHGIAPPDLAAGKRAVELYHALGDQLGLFQALAVLAIMLALAGERSAGEAALAEMDATFDPKWPVWLWGPRQWSTGLCLVEWGRMDECSAVVDRGVRLARAVGEPSALALAMVAREQCDGWMGQIESAVAACHEGIAMSRADGSRGRLGILLGDLGAHLAELGQPDEAEAAAREAVSLRALNGTLWLQLDQIALIALARGRPNEAAMAVGRADRCHAWSQGRRHFHLRRIHALVQARLDEALDPDDQAALKAHGATLTDEAVAWEALGGAPVRVGWCQPSDEEAG